MTGLVIRLENDELVTRAADPKDGRASLITLTSRGREEIQAYRERAIQALSGSIGKMNAQQRECLAVALPLLDQLGEDMAAELDQL